MRWRLTWGEGSWTADDLTGRHLLLIVSGLGADTWDIGPERGPVHLVANLAAFVSLASGASFGEVVAGLMDASVEERHAARIAAKRLRYVGEFFAPLFPGKRTRSYIASLADMQDALGRLIDAVTAGDLAEELSGTGDNAAAGAVRGWVAAQAVAVEPELAKAWRRFNAARAFWPSS